MQEKYDAIVIGAGLSGLAAGIRLAMFGKKVCILEKHSIPGGLNSFYQRKGIQFDVGLHALTNFAKRGEKGLPLTKILKQLRISHDELDLKEQFYSQVAFPELSLSFTNNIEFLIDEVSKNFPGEIDSFLRLVEKVKEFNAFSLEQEFVSTRQILPQYIKDPLLQEMILAPTLAYGSAWENDVDFSQFVILFRSIFLEGLSKPMGGIRKVLGLLEKRFEENGGFLKYKSPVQQIIQNAKGVDGVILKNGAILKSNTIISSAGFPETMGMVQETQKPKITPKIGSFSFTESIAVLNKKPRDLGQKAATIFYSALPKYKYENPKTYYGTETAILSFPNNFEEDPMEEGMARVTFLANYNLWSKLDRPSYKKKKEEVFESSLKLFENFCPKIKDHLILKDVFTPTTIEKFTNHKRGTIYGSPQKQKKGTTPVKGLFLCGTDQGFLGIIGSLLSGISMANLHGFSSSEGVTR